MSSVFLIRSNIKRAVQPQKMVRNDEILDLERLYYLCSQNIGADQLRSPAQLAFDLAYAKIWFVS